MKKFALIGCLLIVGSQTALADGFRRYYGYAPPIYDQVDAMADREINAINAREQAEVMHELQEGDYLEAQEIIQEEEAIKNEIRREAAMYDAARDRNRFGYYSYYR